MSAAVRRGGPGALGVLTLLALTVLGFWAWRSSQKPSGPGLTLAPSTTTGAKSTGSVHPPSSSASASSSAGALELPASLPAEQRYPGLLSAKLGERNQALLAEMRDELGLGSAELDKVQAIFASSKWLGQGNPEISEHPLTRAECRERRAAAPSLPSGDPRCKSPNMVPLFDPSAGETAELARVCIDQYEFPGIACEYPVVWVRADQAADLCHAVGKRICDAHEWEGACAGALKKPEQEYAFGQRRLMIEYLHNKERQIVWAYGPTKDHEKCGTMSKKSRTCSAIDWSVCGSNTYPAGAFPDCKSSFGVFDLHGNAAEHMNLPLTPDELGSRGGSGETEMKGSWFIFASYDAHPDDCRWRAPMWHKTKLMALDSHRNYHLGFRCCRDLG